jgi:hypothetical protein
VPLLPEPRGAASAALISSLSSPAGAFAAPEPDDFEDLQLALYCCYELHYRGFDGVDPRWEWSPSLLAFRGELEREFEAELGSSVPRLDVGMEIDVELRELARSDDEPSLSKHVERDAPLWQVREFMVHRSAYQLKEADPHSWAIPRLWGAPKAALVEVQADEYGSGRPERVHAELFRRSMVAVGLDGTYGGYLDAIPGVTLATVNLMSLFGLHRRLRGALVGHLALFEMTSSIPNRRYAAGLRRLGFAGDATAFFDEHVIADAVHESIAAVDLAGGLARQDPSLASDILWGACALLELERRWTAHVLAAWDEGASSLRSGAPVPA